MDRLPARLFLALILSLSACNGRDDGHPLLDAADSLLNSRPDTVIQLLETADTREMSLAQRMRCRLLLTSARNKCDTVFHSDSLQWALVDYFNRQGSPNERMTAHYLLGRALADMGDAPGAMRIYHKAVESADTTAADCDFRTLCAILGQMAAIYESHQLHGQQVEVLQQCALFAHQGRLAYHFIKAHELQLPAYYAMDDTARCFSLTEECRRLYLDNGMEQAAESVYPTAILILLRDGQYARARKLMLAFETRSGLFDDKGDICPGREHYYNSKGMYYCGVHRLDSAEFFFRKLARYGFSYNYDAYKGLLQVYRERGMADSIARYSALAEQALDSIHADSQDNALALSAASYNYARHEQAAEAKASEAHRAWLVFAMASILFMTALFVAGLLYRKKNSESEEQKSEDQKEIDGLRLELASFQEQQGKRDEREKEAGLLGSGIVGLVHHLAIDRGKIRNLNDSEWQELRQAFREHLPVFTQKALDSGGLGEQEQKVCMLTRIGLHNGDIALMLGTSAQRISNAKKKANAKLFGDNRAATLQNNLKNTEDLLL